MFKINFHRQTAPAAETVSVDPITAREDFTINVDGKTIQELLITLRLDTIDFAEDNNLTWAASDFNIRGVDVRVKMTEARDIVYIFDGAIQFNTKDAAAFIQANEVF